MREKRSIRRYLVYLLFGACVGISLLAPSEKIYARCGADYGTETAFVTNGKKWSQSWGDWALWQPIENYIRITVKGKKPVSRLRYRKQDTNTWYYVNLADKTWKYNRAKGTSTVTAKLKSMEGFLEVQLYDSTSSKRKGTMKLIGKIMKKPVISSIVRGSSSSAKITWKKMNCSICVDILRAASAKGKYTKIATLPYSKGSYTDTGLKSGKKYYYKLRFCHIGYNGRLYSASSAYKSVVLPSKSLSQAPVYINNSWVKTGNYYAKLDKSAGMSNLFYKNTEGYIYTVSSRSNMAVGEGDILYYSDTSDNRVLIYSYNMKTGVRKRICSVEGYLLGYYKGNIYYAEGNFEISGLRTYRLNITSGKKTRIPALDGGGWSCQYKNYMTVLNVGGDPSPTTFRIYNMSTGKVIKKISDCTVFKIIKGKIYYSVCKIADYNSASSVYVQTIYRCNLNGSGVTELASCSGSFLPPNLESNYMYFPCGINSQDDCIKYEYSSKRTVRVSGDFRNGWRLGIRY
ncbi:MAG: hypothetical protein SOZ59_13075 [Candidatus Limivivens sp.]|nr:hypothetical protein [Candidatus Limivivens sp.]